MFNAQHQMRPVVYAKAQQMLYSPQCNLTDSEAGSHYFTNSYSWFTYAEKKNWPRSICQKPKLV